MISIKNYQTEETIRKIAQKAFPEKNLKYFMEYSSGYCNASYLLAFDDDFRAVLKIASNDNSHFQRNEVGLMESEIAALRLIEGKLSVKTPKIYFYDFSCELCSGKYFIMEEISGKDYDSLGRELSKNQKNKIDIKIGKLVKELSYVEGEKFGSLGNLDAQFDSLLELVSFMLNNVLLDIEEKNVSLGEISISEIQTLFEEHKKFFEYNEKPALVHYDLWEGNIFIEPDAQVSRIPADDDETAYKLSGIIDWERALFGDPLMEDRFRLKKYTPAFLDGYGQVQFTYKENRRLLWYDVILYLSMMVEGEFRGYEDSSIYDFSYPLFFRAFDMLKNL